MIQQSGQSGEVAHNLVFFVFLLVFSMVSTSSLVEVLVFFEIFGFLDVCALSVTPRFMGWAGRMPIRIIRCITILHCHGAALKKTHKDCVIHH